MKKNSARFANDIHVPGTRALGLYFIVYMKNGKSFISLLFFIY